MLEKRVFIYFASAGVGKQTDAKYNDNNENATELWYGIWQFMQININY